MPSAFHTFKLVAMTSNNHNSSSVQPPPTPPNPQAHPSSNPQHHDSNVTPTNSLRMSAPVVPQSLMTPSREIRDTSAMPSAGGSARKPRQNVDERDHLLMLKHCYDLRHNFKEGSKTQFWNSVNSAFQQDTGKILAQMSATVGRLIETRRRQLSDWENGVISQKPGGELNDALDAWIEYLREEDGDGEAERMRQVDARRKIEEARKEARRQAIAAEQLATQHNPGLQGQPQQGVLVPTTMRNQVQEEQDEDIVATESSEQAVNGYRPNKKRRRDEPTTTVELHQQHQHQHQQQQQQPWQNQHHPEPHSVLASQHNHIVSQPPPPQFAIPYPQEPVRRVVVEGALTKDDWKDIMGNDARLRALENKVDKIELIVTQNNKLLLQLIQNQSQHTERRDRDRDRHDSNEEDRVPVHLDAEFERDYLTGRYSKTPLPIH